MEPLRDCRNYSRDKVVPGSAETTCAPRTRHGTKLQDILMSDKPNLSYADFHHELTRNPDAPLHKNVGIQRSQVLERRNINQEEIVRYMSNLPSYLEGGKNNKERALSVGVLEWRRLEKWRHSQKQMPPMHSANSPSSSNTSLFSTDGSSTHSSRGQSCSPARQRLQRSSLQSAVEALPKEGHVQDAKSSSGRGHSRSPVRHLKQGSMLESHPRMVYPGGRMPHDIDVFGGNTHKFRDSAAMTSNQFSRQHKLFCAAPRCESKGSDLQSLSEMGKKSLPDKCAVAATLKGKKKIQDVESTKEIGRLRETKLNAADRGCSKRDISGTVVMPRDPSEHNCAGFTGSASFTVNDRLFVDPGEKFLLARNHLEGRLPSSNQLEPSVFCSQHEFGVKSSLQAPHISLRSVTMKIQSASNINGQGIKVPDETPDLPSFSGRIHSSPSRSRHNRQESRQVAEMRRDAAAKPSEELDARKNSESIPKARNSSPIRRLSFAMGKMIKNVGSRDNSPLHRSNSKDCTASDATDSCLFTDNPCSDDLPTNNIRGRSSPLRRLLDPLLRPRPSTCSELSNKKTLFGVDTLKSRSKQLESHPGHSIKLNSRSGIANDAQHNSNTGSSKIQALLQVSFKNGLPLFTFAIDSEKNILAATVRKSSAPGKGHYTWIYTFFAIHEVKRKSGNWFNHGGKGVNHGIVPNVVAQMKVSDSCSIKHENVDDAVSREYDLFAVDVGQGNEYPTDFHPTNELAAIIVKLPRITTGSNIQDDNSSYDWLDNSRESLTGNSQAKISNYTCGGNPNTTVILPGGVHTVPSKGEISRLAQRWRSGGLCDCGGWDLGCQLRVYTDKDKYKTHFGSSEINQDKDNIQLFPQVGQDNQPVLSLVPFKERIYSVEFTSSLSPLQAFAVSVSYIDCRRPQELSEPSKVPEKATAEVGVFEVPIRSKISNQGEASGRYVSFPPHSPVGRV